MKKLILLTLLIFSGSSNAGLFDSLATSDFPEVNAEAYKVSIHGYDMRVYEWVPKTIKDTICIAAFSGGDTNIMQVSCVKVK